MAFWTQFFTWWNGTTLGTRFFTWRKGEKVGEDEFGNVYYRAPSALPASIAERRWVIYKDLAEPSAIPPGWHGWIHHRVDTPPDSNYQKREWQKDHQKNLTGTADAYRPDGSLFKPQPAEGASRPYQAWQPE